MYVRSIYCTLQRRNGYPVFPGKWRKDPFPPRTYQWLSEYRITSNIGTSEMLLLLLCSSMHV